MKSSSFSSFLFLLSRLSLVRFSSSSSSEEEEEEEEEEDSP